MPRNPGIVVSVQPVVARGVVEIPLQMHRSHVGVELVDLAN